jgi:hypothetical protein
MRREGVAWWAQRQPFVSFRAVARSSEWRGERREERVKRAPKRHDLWWIAGRRFRGRLMELGGTMVPEKRME